MELISGRGGSRCWERLGVMSDSSLLHRGQKIDLFLSVISTEPFLLSFPLHPVLLELNAIKIWI